MFEPRSKNQSIQEALKLARYTLEQCITVYGPVKPDQDTSYVAMLRAQMMKRNTFEEVQAYFTLLLAYQLVDSITAN